MTTSLIISDTITPFISVFGMPGWAEIAVLLVIGVLVFGKRLPDVGRNIGKSIVEFKKGVKGINDEINEESDQKASEKKKVADLPPAKVTPDPITQADEAKHHLDD